MPSRSRARVAPARDNVLELELHDAIDLPPRWPIQWGAGVVVCLVILGAVIAAWFQLPDTIDATVSLTTALAPAIVAPKTDGRLDSIFVPDHADVQARQPVALMESGARYPDIMKLETWVAQAGSLEASAPGVRTVAAVPPGLVVGDLQEDYLDLAAKVREYTEASADTLPDARIRSLAREKAQQASLQASYAAARVSQDSMRALALAAADRQRQLAARGFSTAVDAEAARSALLQQDIAVHGAESNRLSAAAREEELHNMLIAAASERRTALAAAWSALLASFARLRQALRVWDDTYVMRAPVAGGVSYLEFLTKHSMVRRAADIMGIVPPDTAIVVEAMLPRSTATRIRPGQRARIELAGLPASDVGYLDATVADMGLLPRDSVLLVHLRLTEGLRTSFGRRVEFRQRMMGVARITTQRVSLLRRLLNGARLVADRG